MEFYSAISEYYDDIFPLNPAQVKFITRMIDPPFQGKRALDIGCGTGNLALALARLGFQVSAIDLDTNMIKKAQNKAGNLNIPDSAVFQVMDMRDIGNHYSEAIFDLATCFGNTLAHLHSKDSLLDFLRKLRKLLKPFGRLLIQIINYDYILDNDIKSLPTIENNEVKFERYYKYQPESNSIYFKTVLLIKKTGRLLENEIPLKPIRRQEIESNLTQAGYHGLQFYGSFAGEELKGNSLPLIIKADR